MRAAVLLIVLASCTAPGASGTPGGCHFGGGGCVTKADCCAGLYCAAGSCASPGASSGGPGSSSGSGNPCGLFGCNGSTGSSSAGGSSGAGSGSGATGGGGGSTTDGGTTGGSSGGAACGGASEACCTTGTCNGTLACEGGVCGQPPAGSTGQPCQKNADCPSGICLPVGQPPGGQPAGGAAWTGNVCTTACSSVADCVAGWSCSPLLGQSGDVCQCHYSPEVCNGKDDDCNGIVDDEPAVDRSCQAQNPLDVCQQERCACASRYACQGGCTNTATDPANCGSCGSACPAGASCVSGACACPSGQTVCGSSCTDTSTDPANCGACGQACAAGDACDGGSCCATNGSSCGAPTPCCGSLTCSFGYCCAPDGALCGSDGDCCGSTCQKGVCGLTEGQTCSIGSTPTCQPPNLVCGALVNSDGLCMAQPGTACTPSTFCYGEVQQGSGPPCSPGCVAVDTYYCYCPGGCASSGVCCELNGQGCNASQDCCDYAQGGFVGCDLPQGGSSPVCCVLLNGACSRDSDCCAPEHCTTNASGVLACQ